MLSLADDRSLSVEALFSRFYKVADFQRDYVWADSDVEKLLTDIDGARNASASSQYFIGAVVLAIGPDETLEIVDGQQRMMTLFLVLAALANRISLFDKVAPEVKVASDKLFDFQLGPIGTTQRLRIIPAFSEGKEALNSILQGSKPVQESDTTIRLWEAYQTAVSYFAENCKNLGDARKQLHFWLKNVSVLPYIASNQKQALTVFETLNSRGIGLTPLDLVKHVVFQHTPEEQWDEVKGHWEELTKLIEILNEQPKRILRYFILVEYGEKVSEADVYDFLRSNDAKTQISKDPIGFVETLRAFIRGYQHVLNGTLPDERAHATMANIRRLTGSGRQYIPFVLAMRRILPFAPIDEYLAAVESFVISYALQRKYTGKIESTFTSWALDVRKVTTLEESKAFLAKTIRPAIEIAGRDAVTALGTARADSIVKSKLYYFLCRLDSHLQMLATGNTSPYREIEKYRATDIEHIWPRSRTTGGNAPTEDEIALLGNVTILERALNRAIKDKTYGEKSSIGYAVSNYFLTKGMVTSAVGGGQAKKALGKVKAFESWGATEIRERQRNLVELAAEVFKWPLPD